MLSFLQRLLIKFLGLDEIHVRLDNLEQHLTRIEEHQVDYQRIQLYIEEAERMYEEDLIKLQQHIQAAILYNVEPLGDA